MFLLHSESNRIDNYSHRSAVLKSSETLRSYADALPELAEPGRRPLHLVSVIHSRHRFPERGHNKAFRLLEERDLELKMTFSGVFYGKTRVQVTRELQFCVNESA